MSLPLWFTKLMKGEPTSTARVKPKPWIIDEQKCLSDEEIHMVEQAALQRRDQGVREQRFSLVRDWFMLELGLQTGLRVAEMASLTHGQFQLANGRSSLSVVGKGQKPRPIWIGSYFKRTYESYCRFKREFGFCVSATEPVLNNLAGDFISRRSLQKACKELFANAGLSSRYSIHCLRHTYATWLLKASNHNYRFVQRQLGHASLRTTQVYAGVLETEGRKALEVLYSARSPSEKGT